MVIYGKITHEELRELFGDAVPIEAVRILMVEDASDDRTVEDVRAEIKALARSMKGSS